mmetsp:Transcript_31332/g.70399  ORF Transcript_31332/g.70399 Transcript_31332/m.70399 type:complete len:91 (+) Transcript_31332:483-755(+)|eukprot:CAMPEP_0172639942 /NCGR_PEP_ID=MMETSP1068-20121228/220610_1 /TAXON_ID=35684 /ORGANISM="Pseudopedinella elastica, Strain CCMP716" /LENGTH=90 /DNA_ID=CAMNT_0013453203 /DNA_START=484 /DNA_END=756 /DNA_ORIENTATION=+
MYSFGDIAQIIYKEWTRHEGTSSLQEGRRTRRKDYKEHDSKEGSKKLRAKKGNIESESNTTKQDEVRPKKLRTRIHLMPNVTYQFGNLFY